MTTALADRARAGRQRRTPARGLILTLGAGALAAFAMLPASVQARGVPETFADLAAKVKPAVVSVAVERKSAPNDRRLSPNFRNPFPEGSPYHEFFRRFFDGPGEGGPSQPQRRFRAVGSGFVVDPTGFIVTNHHVVQRATKIEVIFDNGKRYVAKQVGSDPKTDLALLKITGKAGNGPYPNGPMPFVEWGDSDKTRVGDWIMAVGNPFGLNSTVTAGIVSARGRSLGGAALVDFLQVDAPINKGNSGGPTFNMDGKVIGVNAAIYSPTGGSVGLGFAIPSNTARRVIEQLKSGGKISRGWLGVQIQNVSADIAKAVGLDKPRGALVAAVMPDSPAARAGVKAGDVIVGWAGKKVKDIRDLVRKVAYTKAGRSVAAIVWRDGSRKSLTVLVAESGTQQASASIDPAPEDTAELGLSVALANDELRRRFGLDRDAEGVVILGVRPGSPAAAKNLRPGDLVTHVNGGEVATPNAMTLRVEQARRDGREAVLLRILRRGNPIFVAVKFG